MCVPGDFHRRAVMKRQLCWPLLAALTGVLLTGPPARATHCGACTYPGGLSCPQQVCMPTIKYKVCYQTVYEDRVCVKYRPVSQTVMKEERYSTMEPCYEKHVKEQRYTVCKPVWETYHVTHKYTVCRPV